MHREEFHHRAASELIEITVTALCDDFFQLIQKATTALADSKEYLIDGRVSQMQDDCQGAGSDQSIKIQRPKEGLGKAESWIRELHQYMLSLGESERNHVIAPLDWLYSFTTLYSFDPPLDQCEVKVSKSEPSARGGFAECWEGVFLGKYKVAMKRPHLRSGDEGAVRKRIEREVKVWKGLNHQHVLRFIGIHVCESGMYLVSPWMENGHALDYV